mmetsp:Transcript_43376/g.72108  ORF Transcript_43376/g.72108 Transcript_43376/m.72108 type:complete len:232 (-) Transcript_43376:181-876(-)|eukprot:CAMPEP_0119319072 /NCGR_PEP_ID=MMETSP1333-20130426/48403_1 /TAXON_ID=418940 /ORGANISM="Scyphosphaera apsteinii, Strain RCC1455" /LENGTH=231 /DNA_ID=CAMNT_0007325405 /DNA_START=14 /DNA_END=709 /DNA_ORIENTATION=+
MAVTGSDEETRGLLTQLHAKQAELEKLRKEQQQLDTTLREQRAQTLNHGSIEQVDVRAVDTKGAARAVLCCSPPVLLLWCFGYISNFHFLLASGGVAVVTALNLYASAYAYVKSIAHVNERASRNTPRASHEGAKPLSRKKGKGKDKIAAQDGTADERGANEEFGKISFMTWLGPMAVLMVYRDSMSDAQLVMWVCVLIASLKLGSWLVKKVERSEWRRKLRGEAKKAKGE